MYVLLIYYLFTICDDVKISSFSDILKRTEKSHSDHSQLDKAIATLEEVMT